MSVIVLCQSAQTQYPFSIGRRAAHRSRIPQRRPSSPWQKSALLTVSIVGAVCDRAFFLELTKCGRSQTAPTVGNPSLRLLPRAARRNCFARSRYTGYEVVKAFPHIFQSPVLTRERVRLAYAVAIGTDLLQLLLGPFGWAFADELLDVTAMILIWRLIGFHPLLLPSFVLEFLPLADMLPTWTGCVAIVVAIRKRQQARIPPLPPGPVIDV